jgi:hypothetical protein
MKKIVVCVAVLGLVAAAKAQPPGGPGGFGGPFSPPQPGQILPQFLQDVLSMSADQKKQLEQLQKEVDARLAKILTPEQNKQLQEMRTQTGGMFGGPPGGGFAGPPGGGFGTAGRPDDVKKQLGSTDEEWKVIGPKLQKLIAARQALAADARGPDRGFGFGGFGPPGGGFGGPGGGGFGGPPGERRGPGAGDSGPPGGTPGGPPPMGMFGGPTATSAITQAQADLKAVLSDPKHTADQVKEKVAAVRKARQKARGDVDATQKDLLLMLTAKQEAVLVSLGYFE